MDRCVRCGAELGVGRFCLNCGHRIGDPAPAPATAPPPSARPAPVVPAAPLVREPLALPAQAADPTPAPPTTPGRRLRHRTAAATPVVRTRPESQWDPAEELLPYEEVDDLEPDAPVTGLAWIAWVLGAVLLVALVLVLLRTLGADDGETAADPAGESSTSAPDGGAETSGEGSEPEEAPRGVGKRFDLAAAATVDVPETAPPTTDLDGNLVAYEAGQLNDGNPSTTWRMAGDATGQTITLTLAEPAVVTKVGLVNGYSKQVAGVNWYPHNRRILTVTWTFEDGSTLDQTFAERPGLQMIKVPPVQTSTVGIQITSVTPPGSGNLGRDYTAISEVSVIGRRAG